MDRGQGILKETNLTSHDVLKKFGHLANGRLANAAENVAMGRTGFTANNMQSGLHLKNVRLRTAERGSDG